ncbi:tubulin-specific chaperone C [Patella vulgata]|uniref:tubulin-specific chaperone C n=1 Tax=Patella vulgata TaxID=6465 RepID=UPI00217F29E0|nr:tubulin-specific chaperone C [Patella vulgata]
MADLGDDANMSLEDRHAFMTERLQQRNDIRKSEIQRKKEDKEAPKREKCEHFHENLNREIEEIETELALSSSKTKEELIDHFDGITVRLQKSQKFLSESTLFLPSYDISRANDSLTKLQNILQEKRSEFLPKKKFAFKSRKGTDDGKDKKSKKVESGEMDLRTVDLADCKVINEINKKLSMQPEEINQKDVALAELKSCVVKLYGAPSAIHINKLEDCQIFCGPVSGSIFIRECANCVFVLSCQQLRIHTTKFTNFYIHVTSKAIIEDTSEVKFAPYNWNYPLIEEHYKLSGLEKKRNNWSDVDDFNWLAADEHSPNWSILDLKERILMWDV